MVGSSVVFIGVSYKLYSDVATTEDTAKLFDVLAGATVIGRAGAFYFGALDSSVADFNIQNLEIPTLTTDTYLLSIVVGHKI